MDLGSSSSSSQRVGRSITPRGQGCKRSINRRQPKLRTMPKTLTSEKKRGLRAPLSYLKASS